MHVILFSDGGASNRRGGVCAYVLKDEDKKTIHKEGIFLGNDHTVNQAEYLGLINGLNKALKIGVKTIECYSDSELVVKQINGLYKCRNLDLIVLHEWAYDLIEQFDSFKIEWVPRGKNMEADAMANDAYLEKR